MLPARSSALRTRSEVARLAALVLALAAFLPASAADAEAGRSKAGICAACHGVDGNSSDPLYPSLAAQPPLYVYYQLLQFREARRVDAIMSPLAAPLSDADMKDIAAYYASQAVRPAPPTVDESKVQAGKQVAARFHCGSCHLPTYAGQNHIPRLAGQHFAYLVKELRGFRSGARPDIDGTMASAAHPLSEAEIADVAAFVSGLQ